MPTQPTDAMLDDPLYRRDIIEEERRTWIEENEPDDDEARADDPCADDGLGDY